MINVLFNAETGIVVKTSSIEIPEYEGYIIAETDKLNVGDEFIFEVIIKSVEEGVVTALQQTRNHFQYVPVIRMYQEQLLRSLEMERKMKLLDDQQERLDIIDSAIVAIGAEVWKEV